LNNNKIEKRVEEKREKRNSAREREEKVSPTGVRHSPVDSKRRSGKKKNAIGGGRLRVPTQQTDKTMPRC
jgi:hypothetical protein